MLEGDPNAGKSWLSLAIAALVSTGAPFPFTEEPARGPADVVFLCCEDGLADTVRPRLDAVGADVSRCHVLKAYTARGDG